MEESHSRAEAAVEEETERRVTENQGSQSLQKWVINSREINVTGPVLDSGAWGEVSVALFRGTQVAVKKFHNVIISRHNKGLMRREMQMASSLHHPNLVLFIGATAEEGEMMIVLELMETSLRKQLQVEEYFQPRLVKNISLDVSRALCYLHQMKSDPIIHRDISSANVLLEQKPPPQLWRAKVADYGSVNLMSQLRSEYPGSPAYAAPEARNPNLQSNKMDIYSLGALMLEMVTGKLPIPDSREDLLRQAQHHEEIHHLIQNCLNESCELRPRACDIIIELLK